MTSSVSVTFRFEPKLIPRLLLASALASGFHMLKALPRISIPLPALRAAGQFASQSSLAVLAASTAAPRSSSPALSWTVL